MACPALGYFPHSTAPALILCSTRSFRCSVLPQQPVVLSASLSRTRTQPPLELSIPVPKLISTQHTALHYLQRSVIPIPNLSCLLLVCLLVCLSAETLSTGAAIPRRLAARCSSAPALVNLRCSAALALSCSAINQPSHWRPRKLRSSTAPPLRTLTVILSHSGARPLRSSTTLAISPFSPVLGCVVPRPLRSSPRLRRSCRSFFLFFIFISLLLRRFGSHRSSSRRSIAPVLALCAPR